MVDGFGGDIETAIAQLQQVERAIIAALPTAVAAGAQILKREAEMLAPRRTGRLMGSVADEPHDADSVSASHRVYVESFYAKFVEFGTSRTAAQPFLTPAAEMNKERIEEAIAEVIRPAAGDAILQYRGKLT